MIIRMTAKGIIVGGEALVGEGMPKGVTVGEAALVEGKSRGIIVREEALVVGCLDMGVEASAV